MGSILKVIFRIEYSKIRMLNTIINDEIKKYQRKYSKSNERFIYDWPANSSLTGWFIRLVRVAIDTHIHPDGWLSGVLYLKTMEMEERKRER